MAEELETSDVKSLSNVVYANSDENNVVKLFGSIPEQRETSLTDMGFSLLLSE